MNFTTLFQSYITKSNIIFWLDWVASEIMKRFIQKKINHSNTNTTQWAEWSLYAYFPFNPLATYTETNIREVFSHVKVQMQQKKKGRPEFLLYFLAPLFPPLTMMPACHKYFSAPGFIPVSWNQLEKEFYLHIQLE